MSVPWTLPDGRDRHGDYWLEDGDLVLLVDGVYFKIHRDLLARASGLVEDMLAMPLGNNQSRTEGTTVADAIVIPEVRHQHFETILHAAYRRFVPPEMDTANVIPSENVTPEDLVELLRAAHRLQVPSVLLPVAEVLLPCLEPVERFVLCRDLGLDHIRFADEERRQAEDLMLHSIDHAPAERPPMLHIRPKSDTALEVGPSTSITKKWTMQAFIAIVQSPQVDFPPELGEEIILHVMLARDRVYDMHVWKQRRADFEEEYNSIAQSSGYLPMHDEICFDALPSKQEELELLAGYWEEVEI